MYGKENSSKNQTAESKKVTADKKKKKKKNDLSELEAALAGN